MFDLFDFGVKRELFAIFKFIYLDVYLDIVSNQRVNFHILYLLVVFFFSNKIRFPKNVIVFKLFFLNEHQRSMLQLQINEFVSKSTK